MRTILLAAAIVGFTAPVFAQQRPDPRYAGPPYPGYDRPYDVSPDRDAPPSDAYRQEVGRSAVAMHRMLDAIMRLDVGPIADAVNPGPVPRHQSLGQLARRDDPAFDAHAHQSIDRVSGQMDHMVTTAQRLEPVLRRTIRDMESEIDGALADSGY